MHSSLATQLCASLGLALVLGCNGKSDPGGDGGDTEGTSGGITTAPSSADGGPAGDPTGSMDASATDGTATDPSADGTATDTGMSEDSGTAGGGTGNDPNNPVDCGGNIYACGNGLDDDKDGFIDLNDPECTGPCDDDESSFATGLPGDNMDCKQDCFFDGNSGQGDDGCNWNLRCDPENPGENIGCEYTGGNNCDNMVVQTQECIDFCSALVPNGCDCFGCCTVSTPEGDVNVFLGSGADCSLANLAACSSCTPSADCGNPCDVMGCEVCFGQNAPAEGCGDPECPDGVQSCTSDGEGGSTCPDGLYCLTGCCIDFTPES